MPKLSTLKSGAAWAISCAGLAAMPLGLIIAAPVMHQEPERADLRAWVLFDLVEAEARTRNHRLIGFACGADRLTMTAIEEDHFPICEAIETIESTCPEDMSTAPEPVTARECAAYMGDGW
jgi:hypothetical protein